MCCSGYSTSSKPLLGDTSPGKESDDAWGDDWGGTWGGNSPSPTGSEPEKEQWDSWSNERTEDNTPSTKPEEDGWSSQGWGDFDSAETDKAASKPHKKEKNKHNRSKQKTAEPAIANLIDFGEAEGKPQAEGWEDWREPNDDEAWESLELDAPAKTGQSSLAIGKKGD